MGGALGHPLGHFRLEEPRLVPRLYSLIAEVLTGTGTHVAVLRLPRLKPVGADCTKGTVSGNLVEIEFNDERVKIVDDVGAAWNGAGEIVLAWCSIVDANSTVILLKK